MTPRMDAFFIAMLLLERNMILNMAEKREDGVTSFPPTFDF